VEQNPAQLLFTVADPLFAIPVTNFRVDPHKQAGYRKLVAFLLATVPKRFNVMQDNFLRFHGRHIPPSFMTTSVAPPAGTYLRGGLGLNQRTGP
jgi:hypothetical protein